VKADIVGISIVAVHGLNTTNTKNHAEAAWTAKDKLWLRDFLPTALPHARVLLFGYNANVAFETSIAGVREQATDLLNQLDGKREDSKDRPIIFIAHSLGGIVVKRALVEAKLNGSYKAIGNATYGIAFFGTPHKGGKHVKLGDFATATVRGVLRGPSNSFLEAMKKDSLFADALEKDFQHLFEDYKILSFYETRPMGKFGLV
jgi:triacylglycerol esterase/lipase EstA (alpha/beta hydrolase family)